MNASTKFPVLASPALVGVRGQSASILVEIARSMRARLRGWLGRRDAPVGRGLWLVPCDAVHTFAMRFAIDLAFLDATGRVVRLDRGVRPWRVRICLGAFSVVEFESGMAEMLGLAVGDELVLKEDVR